MVLKLIPISLPHMNYYIVEYSKVKELYYGLLIALTGLPPFLLFFVKFNYLIETYTKFGFFFFYIVFLGVCLQMVYYVQPIITENVKMELSLIDLKSCEFTFAELFFIVFFPNTFYIKRFFFPRPVSNFFPILINYYFFGM